MRAGGITAWRRCLAALCLCLTIAPGFADDFVAIPPLQGRVTDLTNTLFKDEATALEASLTELQRTKGSQVVILMLPTTQPEGIEQFGIRLAGAWKIGRRGVSDGVIIVVAKDDHRMRIEVGYGLEGAIPDAIAGGKLAGAAIDVLVDEPPAKDNPL